MGVDSTTTAGVAADDAEPAIRHGDGRPRQRPSQPATPQRSVQHDGEPVSPHVEPRHESFALGHQAFDLGYDVEEVVDPTGVRDLMEPRKEISIDEFHARCSRVGRSASPSRPWRCPHYPRHPSPPRRKSESPGKRRRVRLTVSEMQDRVEHKTRLGRQFPWTEALPVELQESEPSTPKDSGDAKKQPRMVPKDDVDFFHDKWTGDETEWKDWLSELCVTPDSPNRMRFGKGSDDKSIPLIEISEAAFLGGRLYVTDVAGSESEDNSEDELSAQGARKQLLTQAFTKSDYKNRRRRPPPYQNTLSKPPA